MASKIIALSLATAFLAVGCVAFPEDGGYYDGRYDQRYDRRYELDRRYEQDRRYERQRSGI